MLPLSCCLSAAAICFLAVLFPPQVSASLTVRLSERYPHRTTTGFPCFALLRCDRCRAPPLLRDRGALVADIWTSATTAASQRRVLFLRCCFHLPEFWLTELAEVHYRSPFPVFPLPVTSGWNAGPWAFSRASHPAVTSDACQERERALSTRPELTADQSTLHFSYLTQAVRPHVAPISASNPRYFPASPARCRRSSADGPAGGRRPSGP